MYHSCAKHKDQESDFEMSIEITYSIKEKKIKRKLLQGKNAPTENTEFTFSRL